MNHLSPEQLTDIYYGEEDPALREHLQGCSRCAGDYRLLEELLHTVRHLPVPEPEAAYESQVWARLLPQLPSRKAEPVFPFRPCIFIPAVAALLTIAFLAGMLTQERRHPGGISAQARERVLLLSLNDHLERSQVLLTELLNTPLRSLDFVNEQNQARDLLKENRLLRQASVRAGEGAHSALLDDLERVLLDLANSPPDLSADELRALQNQIKNEGLLFKVRVTSAEARREGQI
jgi:hypothetical protein